MFKGCVNSRVYRLICFHHTQHLGLFDRPRMCTGSLSKQEAQQTLMWFIVSMTSRHFERLRWLREWCVDQTLLLFGCIVRRVWLCRVQVLSLKGFRFVTRLHTFTDGHRWSILSVTITHPHRQQKHSRHPPLLLLTHSVALHVCSLAWGNCEGASPVKLHHWHSDHSTYFKSFQQTVSLLSTK